MVASSVWYTSEEYEVLRLEDSDTIQTGESSLSLEEGAKEHSPLTEEAL